MRYGPVVVPHTCDSEAEARYVGTAGRAKLADECGEKVLVCWCVAETMRYWHAPFSVVRYAIHAEVYECFTPSPRQHRSLLAVTNQDEATAENTCPHLHTTLEIVILDGCNQWFRSCPEII